MRKIMARIALVFFVAVGVGLYFYFFGIQPERKTATEVRSTIGYWRFDEGSLGSRAALTVADSSGSGNLGAVSGQPMFTNDVPVEDVLQTGAKNRLALVFDSPDDRIAFASPFVFNQLGDATLEFWLKHAGGAHQAIFWGRPDNTDTDRFHIYVNSDNTIGVDYRTPSGSLHPIIGGGGPSGGVHFRPNIWEHIALTRTGNIYRLYVNGTLQCTQSDETPNLPTSTGWFISGRRGNDFIGSVDEVRISTGALSPQMFLTEGRTADRL